MPAKLKSLRLNLPFGLGGVTVEIGQAERVAAWKLYVEMSTRISTQPLSIEDGSVREALTSLYNLFGITREILKEAGPEIGQGPHAFGALAIRILNDGLRPFLAKWHAAYSNYEIDQAFELMRQYDLKPPPVHLVNQSAWPELANFFVELEEKRLGLTAYIAELSHIAGVEVE